MQFDKENLVPSFGGAGDNNDLFKQEELCPFAEEIFDYLGDIQDTLWTVKPFGVDFVSVEYMKKLLGKRGYRFIVKDKPFHEIYALKENEPDSLIVEWTGNDEVEDPNYQYQISQVFTDVYRTYVGKGLTLLFDFIDKHYKNDSDNSTGDSK